MSLEVMVVLESYLMTLLSSFSFMTLAWLIYLGLKNPAIVDVFWSVGIAGTSIVFFAFSQNQTNPTNLYTMVMLSLILIWAIRLSLFLLFTRIINQHQDSRYQEMKKGWESKLKLKFLLVYWFQAGLQSFFAFSYLFFVPVSSKETSSSENGWLYFLITWSILSVIFTAHSDLQAYRFKKKNSRNKICQDGWWKYSRHPNYFFEFLFWLGISAIGFLRVWNSSESANQMGMSFLAFLTFLTPVIMIFIFYRLSIPMTEELSLKNKDNYKEYQMTTNKFFIGPHR